MRLIIGSIFVFFITVQLVVLPLTYAESPPSLSLQEEEALFIFFALPDGEAMLIATGNDKNYLVNTASKASEHELIKQINHLGLKQIDGLILTNQNEHECGNTKRMVDRYHIEKIYSHGKVSSRCAHQVTAQTGLEEWKQNESHDLTPSLHVQVVQITKHGDMSLFFTFGKTSLLYLASGDTELEGALMKSSLRAEILKIGDYARTESPSMRLLESIDPHIAMIYPLKGSTPNEGLLERLYESWIDVYQLKKVGTTTVHCTKEDYELYPK
ncbi:hypothetical protein GLW08_17680 [Pontibacillus yanchengensis]|uniref:Uncharacterized protein n=2 Tax=Pontibacillus yanchengensis TaxID=462910 RepID=A0ACC7VLT7_9BACI|nr:hypothetical protein [Pontibacillus yanchengensis]MYL32775.1 hypothetical protein [Pontibacillus yanchengensis]MYL55169.1 hypothetical protein [Pontibacillus yanchengensis]